MEALIVEHLRKIYDGNNGIKDINIKIQKGTIHGLLGNNGAGKSTTMKCIMGIIFPDSGKIKVLGKDLVKNDPEIKRMIGYSPELPAFPHSLTGYECMQAYGYMKGLSKGELRQQISNILDRVNLSDISSRKVSSYSRGMLQRLDLAVAMIGDPEILILDEPTSGLDPSSAEHFRNLIMELAAEGRTIMLSDHRISEVEKICSEITIINDGQTVLQGQVSEILSMAGSEFKYIARFSSVNSDLMQAIERIPGVVRVETLGNKKNVLAITSDHTDLSNFKISQAAAANHTVVYSFEQVTESLEDVFLSIVKQKKAQYEINK